MSLCSLNLYQANEKVYCQWEIWNVWFYFISRWHYLYEEGKDKHYKSFSLVVKGYKHWMRKADIVFCSEFESTRMSSTEGRLMVFVLKKTFFLIDFLFLIYFLLEFLVEIYIALKLLWKFGFERNFVSFSFNEHYSQHSEV